MGARLVYRPETLTDLAAVARVTAPLAGKGREASLGIEWKPLDAPLYIAAEHRFGLDGTQGGPAIGLIGGVDRETAHFRIEGYAQAGMIWRSAREPYVDGSIRLLRPVPVPNKVALRTGVGLWGGAQRNVERLDIGPSISASHGPLQIRIDWRQRIAGNARPGSGLTLTVGGDF